MKPLSFRPLVALLLIIAFLCNIRADDSILDPVDVESIKQNAEVFPFQAEISRMMNILIKSLYKNKDIFLRELISNASDALGKIRIQSLSDPSVLKDKPDFKILIRANPNENTLTIADTGVGMTKEDMKDKLGTIAKSGTAEFLESLQKKDDANLIGKFGVGFYSVFLVADKVTVISKHNNDDQYVWQCNAENEYTLAKDSRGNTLGRGTEIIIHLKTDSKDMLEESKLKELIARHSEFIDFPIYVYSSIKKTETVPLTEEEIAEKKEAIRKSKEEKKKETEEKKDGEAEVEDVDEQKDEEKEDEIPTTKSVETTVEEYVHVNQNKPIWMNDQKDLTKERYDAFYKSFSKDSKEPMSFTHFKAEGEVEFRGLIFVPKESKVNPFTSTEVHDAISLFVRRVFITDELPDFLPKYLTFVKGLVDSDDLPLNVSRETLQQNKVLSIIKKGVVSKILDLFKQLSKDEEKYKAFYSAYGSNLKLGIVTDEKNRNKLAKLVRFYSSSSQDKLVSFDEYISRMKKKQESIYYLAGSSLDEVKNSPFLEKLVGRGYEVLFMTDSIDEYMFQSLYEYEKYKFQSAAKAGLKFGDEDEMEKKATEEETERLKPLSEWFKKVLSNKVNKVVVSNRLTTSPCAVVAPAYAWSGNMRKIMKAHSGDKQDPMAQFFAPEKLTLEINPKHPIIQSLFDKVKSDAADSVAEFQANVLYDTTLIASGYELSSTADYAKNVEKMLRQNLGVDLEAKAEVEIKPAPAVKTEEDLKEEQEAKKNEESGERGDAENANLDLDDMLDKTDNNEASPNHEEL